jgi:16S rRNA processing protein RimM
MAGDFLENYTIVGEILRSHGIKGELKVRPETFDPSRFKSLKRVFLAHPSHKEVREFEITSVRGSDSLLIVKFNHINNPEDAKLYNQYLILIPDEERLPLDDGSFYISDLIDLDVKDKDHNVFGKVLDVLDYPANFVFEIKMDNKTILAPWIDDCILNINLDENHIIIDRDFLAEL